MRTRLSSAIPESYSKAEEYKVIISDGEQKITNAHADHELGESGFELTCYP